MKILYLCHRVPYPPNKGDKIRAFHHLKALSVRHDIDLFTLVDRASDVDQRHALAPYCRRIEIAELNAVSSRLRSLAYLFTRRPLTLPWFHSPKLQKTIHRALSSRSYDRIFIYSSTMAQYVEAEKDIPIVIDLVDVDSDKWLQYANFVPFPMASIYQREARCLREYERCVCEKAWSTLLTTEREARLLRQICPGARVRVIPNGVDSNYFKPVLTQDRPVALDIVFTGDMSYFPNGEAVAYFAHRVLPAIRRSVPSVRFSIVGRDPSGSVRRLRKIAGVEVTGPVPDVRPYLERAQVSVAPFSISAGIPNKILEAMAFGLPVVGTPCAVQGLSPNVAAALETAATPEEFAEKTVGLLNDSGLARNKGLECRRRVIAEYRWDRSMQQVLETVENHVGSEEPAALPLPR